jgi:dTDP-4-dehydrorhamnose 3,5-epimerase-like enzyme
MEKGYKIIKLPEYEKEIPESGSDICRLFKKKGELTFISKDSINYLAYVAFPKGGIPRGNHYHEKKLEFIYLAKGKIKLYVRPANKPEEKPEEVIVEEGSIIRMEPMWAHENQSTCIKFLNLLSIVFNATSKYSEKQNENEEKIRARSIALALFLALIFALALFLALIFKFSLF